MKIVTGVTGNISSGKSKLCEFFKELGGIWIDADKIGHMIIEKNKEKIKEIFGDYLSRKEIAQIIFSDIKKKIKYEKWIHKEIGKEIKRAIEQGDEGYYFIEGALIFEANADRIMDYVIYVEAGDNVLIQRSKQKGYSEELIKRIIELQKKFKGKEERADFVIINDGSVDDLKKKAEEIFKIIRNKKPSFVCDSTCIRECRWLRLLGFDSIYARFIKEITRAIYEEKRFLLTRKKSGYLYPGWKIFRVPEGTFELRMKRITEYFDLKDKISLFSRCSECNSEIEEIEKEKVKERVPYYTFKTQEKFYICKNCKKIYWKGSHYFYFGKHIRKILQ